MRCSYIALAAAVAVGGLSSVATANATSIMASGVNTAADQVTLVDQAGFLFGGRQHCWYADGWNGPGWYWCGYRHRRGHGWGGGEGFNGWRHK